MRALKWTAGIACTLLLCVLSACCAPAPVPYESVSAPPTSPVPLLCRAQGELVQTSTPVQPLSVQKQTVMAYIYQRLLAQESEIDLSEFGINKGEITALFTDVMNHYPDLFFVESGISYTYNSAGTVVTVKPSYCLTGDALTAAQQACAQALDEICAGVDASWSDFEIALYLHDYLCMHFAYDTDYEIYDMYGFLTSGKGVCQAYTLTYMELLGRFGIQSDVAVSVRMNHIWNVITLGGTDYHVDVTWDDPVPNTPGQALHQNFLRSDAGIASTGHVDWVTEAACGSDAYESTFIMEVARPFYYTAGQWFYADGAKREILAVDFSTMNTRGVLTTDEKWLTPDGDSYYVDAFWGMGAYRGNLIYNTPGKIFAHRVQNGVTVQIMANVPAGMQIFGLWTEGDTVYYLVSDTPNGQMQMLSVSVADLADYIPGDADQNGVVDGRDVTAIRRYLQGLPSVCHLDAADLDDSGAVDARDVEILRAYLVENY